MPLGDPIWVELARLSGRPEAEGLRFTLESVGVAARVRRRGMLEAEGDDTGEPDHDRLTWAVLVREQQLTRAREILAEELPLAGGSEPAAVVRGPGLHWVIGLLVTHLLVFLAMEGCGGSERREVLLRFGASHAPSILGGEWWRPVTAVFLHIGVQHLISNMAALLVLGPPVLHGWGIGRFFFIYVVTGVVGNLVSLAVAPGPVVKAGASGALLGLLGALAGARIRRRRHPGLPSRLRTWHVVAMVIAFYGFVVGMGPADHLAHIGGLLGGGVLAFLVPPVGEAQSRGSSRRTAVLLGAAALALVLLAGLLTLRSAGLRR